MQANLSDLKGQARRLRTALTELQVELPHTAVLNLVARMQGDRHWEALSARLAAIATDMPGTETPDTGADDRWLGWLEACLRLEGFEESDLDEMVYDVRDSAQQINNDGMSAQLEALLEAHAGPNAADPAAARAALVHSLCDELQLQLPMPGAVNIRRRDVPFIRTRVSVCAGSPLERALDIDSLEWFGQATDEQICALARDGLCNTETSDHVVLWLAEHSQDPELKDQLGQLLQYMRSVHETHGHEPVSDVVGLTVSIDEDAFSDFTDCYRAIGRAI